MSLRLQILELHDATLGAFLSPVSPREKQSAKPFAGVLLLRRRAARRKFRASMTVGSDPGLRTYSAHTRPHKCKA